MSEFDKKISALTSGTDSVATDQYVIARADGSNYKISGALVAAAATKVGTLAELAVTGNVTLGADVVVSRGAANRLDLASGDSLNLVSGSLKIAGTDVLSATTLGSGVTASSLTSVGTLTALEVSSSAGLIAGFNSTAANGVYTEYRNSSTVIGDIGSAAQVVSGGANTDFAINARGSRNFIFGTNNAERARITAGGELLTGGKTTATANGGDVQVSSGITFPATQVAKSDANTLDDYEEGTWTPSFTATGATFTYSFQIGRYTKIGRSVTVQGRISLDGSAPTGGSGAVSIAGLPFSTAAVISAAEWGNIGVIGRAENFAADTPLAVKASNGATTMQMYYRTAIGGGTANTDFADMAASVTVLFTATYEVD